MKQVALSPGEVDYLRVCLAEHAVAARGVVVEAACSPAIAQASRMGGSVLSNVVVGGPCAKWEDIDLDEAAPDMADLAAAVAGSVDILGVASGVPSAPGNSTLVVAGPIGDLWLL